MLNLLDIISKYFFLVVTSIVGGLYFFRALKLIFNLKILKYKVFNFPDDRGYRIGYCICVSVLATIAIYLQINK